MKRLLLITVLMTCAFVSKAQVTAGDCSGAVNICTNSSFAIDPNGFGSIEEFTTASNISNPQTNPNNGPSGTPNDGCCLSGELNSTWMIINVSSSGLLEFSMGGPNTFGNYFDWSMWAYDANTCSGIQNNTLAPVQCNWNWTDNGLTGAATVANINSLGGDMGDFEVPLNVNCGDQFIMCFSNYSSATTTVPLNFFGSAQVDCQTFTPPINVNDETICEGQCATLTATGGSTYDWAINGDLSATTGATVDACPTGPGVYEYYVTGNGSCGPGTDTATVIVLSSTDPACSTPCPTLDSIPVIDASCSGTCDGSLTIYASGATEYSIDNGVTFQASNSFNNLCAGTYSIVVQDAGGCQDFGQAIISEPLPFVVTVSQINLLCFNQCDGEININATGGTTTYQYSIDNGANYSTSPNFTGLCAGTYDVLVNDNGTCSYSEQIILTEPPLLGSAVGVTDATCFGMCNGMINSIPYGGDGNYSYSWTPAVGNVPLINNLCVGQYDLTVSDGNGCTWDTTLNVNGPVAVSIDNILETNETCGGDCTGEIEVTSSGAIEFSLDGTNFNTNNIFTGLCAGNYTVYVQDANGCQDTQPATVTGPTAVSVTALSDTVICIGGTASLTSTGTGGVGGYSYSWDNGDVSQSINVSPLSPTAYCVTATDANGCSSFPACVTVSLHQALSVTAFSDQTICNGDDAPISAIANGGNGGPYTYNWDQGIGSGAVQTVSPSANTVYTVTVQDGCETPSVSTSVTIGVIPTPVISFTADTLEGCMPLQVIFTEAGVPAGSDCLWSFGDGGANLDCMNVQHEYTEPGCWDVSLSISTPEGCQTAVTIPNYICVYDYPQSEFSFGPQPTTILNPEITFINESLNATYPGGSNSYIWTFDTQGEAINDNSENPIYSFPNGAPGAYQTCLLAISPEGCEHESCQEVVINEEFLIYVPNAFTPDGDGVNDYFYPEVIGADTEDFELLIFNRWGELIHTSNNPTTGWDGYYNGMEVQSDVYVWKIECKDVAFGNKQSFVGHVSLIR